MKFWLIGFCVILSACSSESDKTFKPDPNAVYFEVAETTPEHGDSYIIALTDAELIREARQIIADEQNKIVVAEIAPVKDVTRERNIDLKNNRKWTWHVSRVEGFTDMTMEILDGWPGYVEENFDEWVRITKGSNGKGRIGFWSYTLTREVDPAELTTH